MTQTALTGRRYQPLPARPGATVSVVIPCYNYARYLVEAVDSVLDQAGVEVEVIVVDDASLDQSLAVARRLAAESDRVRVIANAENLGAVETFNRGLAAATGEFLVRLDADDVLTPGSLQRAVAVMQSFPRVGLVYGHPIHFAGPTLPTSRQQAESWTVWTGSEWLAARAMDGTNVITSPEVVMRRSVVDLTGGQRPLAHTHDMEMWLRLSAYSDVAYIRGADQAWHREHAGSLSTQAEEPLVILGEIRDAFTLLFDEVGPLLPDGAPLREAAYHAVASEALDQATRLLDRGTPSEAVPKLLDFAAQCSPGIRSTRAWRRVTERAMADRAPNTMVAVLRGALPRIGRRVRASRRYARWARTGDYERMRLHWGRTETGVGSTWAQ
ncbi:glycosyltransferase family 2 protein [Leifsonia shinshuensis]|uniref:glycosyltransferase family 2 protein n=1 Tax=Leifsonia shinshuensis TaxID=150026 RepID=UPI0016297C38|nr:glycosyltransferase family 2 protein [Leifsonia shinshuensis]